MRTTPAVALALSVTLAASLGACAARKAPLWKAVDAAPGERHLANLRQLTFGGENAEAYWSFDGGDLVFQSREGDQDCDQEYVMHRDGTGRRLVSTGGGVVTCGYFFPGDERVVFASTHESMGRACPPKPDRSQGYVWPLYDYQLYTATRYGTDVRPLAPAPGSYNAEATISKDGWIVFTSTRDGDLDLYKMRLDGTGLVRLTNTVGYDGGAFFSADGKKIVYRASRPEPGPELDEYRALLAKKLVRPKRLEIWVMNADGTDQHQVTQVGAANFAPFFHPDGKRILFASNVKDPRGPNFDLYLVNEDGSGLEQVTTYEGFDGFPMFSPDGKQLVFASNRFGSKPGEINIFVADWRE